MTATQAEAVGSEVSPHSRLAALVLCWPLGLFGAHRFLVGKVGTGLLQLLTFGGFQIWTLIDFVLILFGRFTDRTGRPVKHWTRRGAEWQLVPILVVAAATSGLVGSWVGVLLRSAAPSFAQVVWPLVVVQAMGGLAIGLAVESNRFLHAVAASVVGSYVGFLVVIVVGLAVVGDQVDAGQGVGLGALVIAGVLYLVAPVAGLLSLVGGAVADAAA